MLDEDLRFLEASRPVEATDDAEDGQPRRVD
jgi:hypothetical protein